MQVRRHMCEGRLSSQPHVEMAVHRGARLMSCRNDGDVLCRMAWYFLYRTLLLNASMRR